MINSRQHHPRLRTRLLVLALYKYECQSGQWTNSIPTAQRYTYYFKHLTLHTDTFWMDWRCPKFIYLRMINNYRWTESNSSVVALHSLSIR